jgi:hypothetical protein
VFIELETPSRKVSPRVSVGVDGGFCAAHPRPKTRVSPVVTPVLNAAPQLLELQFDTYLLCIREGEPPFRVTDFEAPSEKVLPRVSVGVEGGPCPDHPRPKARMFPETTFVVNPSPHEAALQFDA